jgi:chorismate mutase
LDKSSGLVLVSESALPEVIIKVLHAKELLAASQQMSSSEACRIVGISRSAYYKYKDSVFRYEEHSDDNIFAINLLLQDKQGVLSAVISQLYELGMNIIKINQNPPVDSVAPVSLSVRNDSDCGKAELSERLSSTEGVLDVKIMRNSEII